MKKMTQSLMAVALAAGSLVSLPACTDGEIIASSIIIGAAVIADDGHDHSHHHHRRPSRPHRPVRPGHRHVYSLDQGQPLAINLGAETEQVATPEFVSTDARVINTAEKYEISHYAATYVVRAILLAQAKDLSGVKDLGLEKSDMKKIYKGEALSEVKVQAMASKLLMSVEDTALLVNDISADVKAEKAAQKN